MGNKLATVDADGFVTGFYDDEIHESSGIPEGAIAITAAAHKELLNGQNAGLLLKVEPDGTPMLVERAAPSIESLRAQAWDRIKTERDRRKAGGVLVGAHWFHSDADSRIQWLGIKDSARDMLADGATSAETIHELGQPMKWKTLAGAFIVVTVQMALDVVAATKELDARLFAMAEHKRAEVEVADNPAAYDVLAGWPATYGEET